jgi:hypothetical protein
MTELERKAKKLYDECPTVKPKWGQLGEATKSVWLEKAGRIDKGKKK